MKQKSPLGYGADFNGYEQTVEELRQTTGAQVGSTTAIRVLRNGPMSGTVVVYDLQGRKNDSRMTNKGLYVINGKKILSR